MPQNKPAAAPLDPLRNPKDPLRKTSNEAGIEAYQKISQLLDREQLPCDAVIVAGFNIIINALRQAHARKDGAERRFDELSAKAKGVLLDEHYDGIGNRRNVFPFHQVIDVPLLNLKDKR